MPISKQRLKKWIKMIFGKSIDHAPQKRGKFFVQNKIKGYFNDLTNKVLMQKELIESDELPLVEDDDGTLVYFPIAIIQYSLGLYDLYLDTNDEKYINKFCQCVNWLVEKLNDDGSLDNFSCFNLPPYSAMCQGELISLFCRAYVYLNDEKYLLLAKKAYEFMLTPVTDGGTCLKNDGIILLEYTNHSPVLNGWIFAIMGIYDYMIVSDDGEIKNVFIQSIKTLENYLERFDCGYWSFYDLDNRIASKFYHNLHIAQLDVLKDITKSESISLHLNSFIRYNRNVFHRIKAFVKKAIQKIKE